MAIQLNIIKLLSKACFRKDSIIWTLSNMMTNKFPSQPETRPHSTEVCCLLLCFISLEKESWGFPPVFLFCLCMVHDASKAPGTMQWANRTGRADSAISRSLSSTFSLGLKLHMHVNSLWGWRPCSCSVLINGHISSVRCNHAPSPVRHLVRSVC